MKKLILFLILFLTANIANIWAYDATAYTNSQPSYMYENDYTSVKLRENESTDLQAPEEVVNEQTQTPDATQTAAMVENFAQKQKADSNYFLQNYEYSDAGLYCPPLRDDVKSSYITIIDTIDFSSGSITCSVAEKPFGFSNMSNDFKNASSFPNLKIVKTETFANKKYLDLLEQRASTADSLIEPEAKEAASLYAQKMQLIKQTVSQKISNNVRDSSTGSIYLNLSQIIDAVMVFDQQIINIESSLAANDIILNPPYVQSFKAAHIREKVEQNNKLLYDISAELNQKWSILPVFFDPKAPNSVEQKKSDAYQVLGSGLNKLLYFIVKYYDVITWSVNTFLFGAILFALYNISHYFFERAGNENERKNIKFKAGLTGFTAFLLIVFTSTDAVYQDESGMKVELSKLQGFVGVLSRETNAIANKLSEAIIDSQSGGMFTSSSVMSPSEVEHIAQNHKKREMIKEYQSNHLPRCYNSFNTDLLKSQNQESYKNNNSVFISASSIHLKNDISPYNTVQNGGYVQNENWATSNFESAKYSLDACQQIEKDYKTNLLKLDIGTRKINNFNNIDLQDKNFDGKQAIMEKIWLSFQQYGYVALPLIAVADVYERVWELPSKKSEEYLALLSDFDMKESIKFIASNILFHYAVGGGIDEWSGDKYKIMTDALVGWIPFGIGSGLSNFGSGAMGFATSILVVDSLVDIITSLRGLFIFAISTVMLFLMFVAKFIVFWGVPFFIIYAFMSQSVEKTSRLVVKTILTFFKPVVLIFVVFLTLFVMDFFHNVLNLFLEEMATVLSGQGGYIETFTAYVIKNVGQIFAILIEFLVSFLLVVKGTNSIYAFFEQNSNDISDVVSEGIASAVQNKVVK